MYYQTSKSTLGPYLSGGCVQLIYLSSVCSFETNIPITHALQVAGNPGR